jgi:hypothetical protein
VIQVVGKPYVIRRGSTRAELNCLIGLVLFMLAALIAAPFLPDESHPGRSFGWHAWPFIAFDGIGVLALCFRIYHQFRTLAECWVIDDDSIRFVRGSDTVWRCAWEDFGGWRRATKLSVKDAIIAEQPHEILDRNGKAVGRILLRADGGADIRLVRREFERNLPEGGVSPVTLESRPAKDRSAAFCWSMIVGGSILFLGGTIALQLIFAAVRAGSDTGTPLSLWLQAVPARTSLPISAILPGAILSTWGFMAFMGRTSILKEETRKEPAYGPTLQNFQLDKMDRLPLVELREGVAYAYVDTAALHRSVEDWRTSAGCLGWLLCLPIVLVALMPTSLPWVPLLVVAAMASVVVAIYQTAVRVALFRDRHVEDRFTLVGDQLIVRRGDLETSYPWPPKTLHTPPTLMQGFLFGYEEVGNGTSKYRLDRRYLIEVPPQSEWRLANSRSPEAASTSTSHA